MSFNHLLIILILFSKNINGNIKEKVFFQLCNVISMCPLYIRILCGFLDGNILISNLAYSISPLGKSLPFSLLEATCL